MATRAWLSGTATFGSTQLGEVYSVSYDKGGMTAARSKDFPYSAAAGSVSIELFGNVSSSIWGKRDTLSVSGSVSLTGSAICTSVGAVAQVNDAQRQTVTFQFIG